MSQHNEDRLQHNGKGANDAQKAQSAYFIARGAYNVVDGIKEKDLEKAGDGLATAGISSAVAAPVLAPMAGGAVASVAGTAAGAAVATAFLPVTLGVGAVGAVLWWVGRSSK